MRTSKDLDILIPLENVAAAEEVLETLGYVTKEGRRITAVQSWKWREHHVCYMHPVKRTQVEVHWRLNPDSGNVHLRAHLTTPLSGANRGAAD